MILPPKLMEGESWKFAFIFVSWVPSQLIRIWSQSVDFPIFAAIFTSLSKPNLGLYTFSGGHVGVNGWGWGWSLDEGGGGGGGWGVIFATLCIEFSWLTVFLKTRGYLLAWVPSHLVLPGHVLPFWGFHNFQHINHLLVRTITRHLFKLGSPNLVHRSKTLWLRTLLFFFFWGGGGGGGGCNWPWPSRWNLTSNSKLTPFLACPNHYWPPILVRISKFGQQMYFSTVKIPVNSGLDWGWNSPSFLIPKLIYLRCGGVHWDCETAPGFFQCCSGTVSQTLHQCTWGTHSQSGMGPLVMLCLIWIKQNRHIDCFTVWLFHNTTMLYHILI